MIYYIILYNLPLLPLLLRAEVCVASACDLFPEEVSYHGESASTIAVDASCMVDFIGAQSAEGTPWDSLCPVHIGVAKRRRLN